MHEILINLLAIGCDIENTIDRFSGNDALYIKFLLRFIDDKNMQEFVENYEKAEYEKAVFNIHALKGVSGNLGLTSIFELSQTILNALRSDNICADKEVALLKRAYAETCDIIKQ